MSANNYTVTKDANSGMVGLSKAGESTMIDFGGIPAIQIFAKEYPEVPARVINELLARDGGYTDIRESDYDITLMHPNEYRVIVRDSIEDVWAAAAESAVKYFELSDLTMRCDRLAGDNPVSMENPWGGDGEWSGPVVLVSDNYVVQSLEDGKFVAHQKEKIGDVLVGVSMHAIQRRGEIVHLKINL